jgi:hypothetical protein
MLLRRGYLKRERKRRYSRLSLPDSENYTIFHALLETLTKQKEEEDSRQHRFPRKQRILKDLAAMLLTASGFITLAWVGQLTWHDVTVWGKNITLVFFGSRGENISLGIGMKVAHYFLVGFMLFFSGLVTLIQSRRATRVGFFDFNTECRGRERHDVTIKKRHPALLESAINLFEQIWNEQESISLEGIHAS